MIWDIFTYTVFWTLPLIGGIVLVAFFSLMGAHQAKPKQGEPAPPPPLERPKKMEKPTGPILFDVEGDNRVRISTISHGVARLLGAAMIIGLAGEVMPQAVFAWWGEHEFAVDSRHFNLALWAGVFWTISYDFFEWFSNEKPLGTFHAFWIQKNFLGGYPTEESTPDGTTPIIADTTVDAHVERPGG